MSDTTAPAPTRAAIYARISQDREGAGINVQTQLKDCREYCTVKGFHVVAEYSDNDQSAWSGKPRPGYKNLLKDMRDRQFNVLVVLHTDRLTRSMRDLEDIIEIAEPRNVWIHSLREVEIDLTTAQGQMVARLGALLARHESDRKAERVRRKHEELARAGKPASLRNSFGYDNDGKVVPEQAAVITEMVRRVLAGESLRSIAAWLTETGVPTAKGGNWGSSTIKQILTSGRIAGWREWTPRTPIGDQRDDWSGRPRRGHGDGTLVAKGSWEPIISLDEHEALRGLLFDPDRRKATRRHYLLSAGILRCGLCGKGMNHKTETQHSSKRDAEGNRIVLRKVSRYACIKQYGRGCGKMSISHPDVDRWVTHALFKVLAGTDLDRNRPRVDEVARLQNKISATRLRLKQINDMFVDEKIDEAEFLDMRDTVKRRLQAIEEQLPAPDPLGSIAALAGEPNRVAEVWPDMNLDRRRALLLTVMNRIVIHPAKPPKERPRGFDPDRIEIEWRA